MVGVSEKVSLTEGNISNHYIRIKQLNGLITEDVCDSGATIMLDLDGVGQVNTSVDRTKGILSEREAIGQFFAENRLRSGDEVSAVGIGAGHLNRDDHGEKRRSRRRVSIFVFQVGHLHVFSDEEAPVFRDKKQGPTL